MPMLRSDIPDSSKGAEYFNPDHLDANLIASYASGWHAEECDDILANFELNKDSMLRQSCRCSQEVANGSDATPMECSIFSHKERPKEADPEDADDPPEPPTPLPTGGEDADGGD